MDLLTVICLFITLVLGPVRVMASPDGGSFDQTSPG